MTRPHVTRRCPKADCRRKQPCPIHKSKGWRASKSPPLPPDWEKKRNYIRKMANGKCKKCGIQCWDHGSCDHIVNRMRGGTEDLSNLQWICRNCHKIKTGKEARYGRHKGNPQMGKPRPKN